VFTSRGGWARIGGGTWIAGEQLVYNFEVEGAHTYFVGETGAWVHNSCGLLYHYTDEAGAMGIADAGAILPDSRGRVFVTGDQISAADASNALFMGRGGERGAWRVEIDLSDLSGLDNRFATPQPNELVHRGAIVDGRNASLRVVPNDF